MRETTPPVTGHPLAARIDYAALMRSLWLLLPLVLGAAACGPGPLGSVRGQRPQRCGALRARVTGLLEQGRVDRALRTLRAPSGMCADASRELADLRVKGLVALGDAKGLVELSHELGPDAPSDVHADLSPVDPHRAALEARRLREAGRLAEAQLLLDRARFQLERAHGPGALVLLHHTSPRFLRHGSSFVGVVQALDGAGDSPALVTWDTLTNRPTRLLATLGPDASLSVFEPVGLQVGQAGFYELAEAAGLFPAPGARSHTHVVPTADVLLLLGPRSLQARERHTLRSLGATPAPWGEVRAARLEGGASPVVVVDAPDKSWVVSPRDQKILASAPALLGARWDAPAGWVSVTRRGADAEPALDVLDAQSAQDAASPKVLLTVSKTSGAHAALGGGRLAVGLRGADKQPLEVLWVEPRSGKKLTLRFAEHAGASASRLGVTAEGVVCAERRLGERLSGPCDAAPLFLAATGGKVSAKGARCVLDERGGATLVKLPPSRPAGRSWGLARPSGQAAACTADAQAGLAVLLEVREAGGVAVEAWAVGVDPATGEVRFEVSLEVGATGSARPSWGVAVGPSGKGAWVRVPGRDHWVGADGKRASIPAGGAAPWPGDAGSGGAAAGVLRYEDGAVLELDSGLLLAGLPFPATPAGAGSAELGGARLTFDGATLAASAPLDARADVALACRFGDLLVPWEVCAERDLVTSD